MATEAQVFTIGNLRLEPDQLLELQDHRTISSVKRCEIKAICLRHGILARHPGMQIVFGVFLTLISGYVLVAYLQLATASAFMTITMLSVVFVGLGLWVIFDAARRGHFVEVVTEIRTTKMAVGKALNSREAAEIQRRLRDYLQSERG